MLGPRRIPFVVCPTKNECLISKWPWMLYRSHSNTQMDSHTIRSGCSSVSSKEPNSKRVKGTSSGGDSVK
jgi:hypothetical protein